MLRVVQPQESRLLESKSITSDVVSSLHSLATGLVVVWCKIMSSRYRCSKSLRIHELTYFLNISLGPTQKQIQGHIQFSPKDEHCRGKLGRLNVMTSIGVVNASLCLSDDPEQMLHCELIFYIQSCHPTDRRLSVSYESQADTAKMSPLLRRYLLLLTKPNNVFYKMRKKKMNIYCFHLNRVAYSLLDVSVSLLAYGLSVIF